MKAVIADVAIDPKQIAAYQRDMRGIARELPRAISAATRRVTDAARARIVQGVREDLNVQSQKLYQRGNRRRPIWEILTRVGGLVVAGRVTVAGQYDATAAPVSAKEGIGRIPMAAGRFAVKALKRGGISYQILRQGARERLTTPDETYNMTAPFMAKMRSGFVAAFRRRRDSGKIALLHGPSVPHVAQRRPAIKALLRTEARRMYDAQVRHEVEYRIARHRENHK